MPPPSEPRPHYPAIWPSLLIAATLAAILPIEWIKYRDRGKFLSLHILAAPIYIPLAFGLIWPLLIGIQALFAKSARRIRLRRNRISAVLFVVSFGCSVPFVRGEYRSFVIDRDDERAEKLRLEQLNAQLQEDRLEADQALLDGGITAFNEPLTGPQVDAVEGYIYTHSKVPADLRLASAHYRTSVPIMSYLASRPACPPEALEAVFENALSLQKTSSPSDAGGVFDILGDLARNPGTPMPIVTSLLRSDDPGVREAAAVNPELPKPEKIGYLKRAAASATFSERQLAAQNPDTPQRLLEQLASDPILAGDVAWNPGAPRELLETLAKSPKEWLRARAMQTLAKQRAPE